MGYVVTWTMSAFQVSVTRGQDGSFPLAAVPDMLDKEKIALTALSSDMLPWYFFWDL